MRTKIAIAPSIGVAVIVAASIFSNAAHAGCCDSSVLQGGGWVWRPVGWTWGTGLMWRAEGWGAPVWGYETCYRPRRVLTPWGWSWQVVRVCYR